MLIAMNAVNNLKAALYLLYNSRPLAFSWKPGDKNACSIFISGKTWSFRHQSFGHRYPRNKKDGDRNGQRSDYGNPSPGYRKGQDIETPPHCDLTEVVGMPGITP